MEKRALICAGFILLFLFAASGANAAITISQPDDAYNLGDTINSEFRISYSEDASAYFKAVLSCSSDTLMYFSPVEIEKNREKAVSISWPVSKASGLCKILAYLDKDSSGAEHLMTGESAQFELSDKINMNASINKELFRPDEQLKIEGNAELDNGNSFDGTVVIKIDGTEHLAQASEGKFSSSEKIDSGITPGTHSIRISAKDGSGNSGGLNLSLDAEGIPTSLTIGLSNKSIMPGEAITLTPKVLDQAGGIMNKEIYLKIYSPKTSIFGKETVLFEEITTSGNSTQYIFDRYAKPGNYNIEANFEELKTEENIEIKIHEKINFTVINNTLYVGNLGNVPYKKPIEVAFEIENQTSTKIIELNLEVGENRTYALKAPKGTYEIAVSAENETQKFPAALTGDVITMLEIGQSEPSNYFILIFFAFLVIVAVILAIFISKRKKRRYAPKEKTVPTDSYGRRMKPAEMQRMGTIPKGSPLKIAFAKHSSKLAANSLIPSVIYGTKQEITAVDIQLEGSKDRADEFMAAACEKIKLHQGVADVHGNSLIIIFNVVKQQRHDMAAIKTAQEIIRLGQKMNFRTRAGINTGMATVSAIGADKTASYTQIKNSVSIAKALAMKARADEIMISEEIYKRAGDAIKTRRASPYNIGESRAIEVYAISDAQPEEKKDDMQWFIDRAIGKKK